MGAHKNRLGEAILMSTHNIGFYEDLTKIIFELSSNTHLISSAEQTLLKSKLTLSYRLLLLNSSAFLFLEHLKLYNKQSDFKSK